MRAHKVTTQTELVIQEVRLEISRAQAKFPNTEHMLAAITEELGELAQALLQQQHEPEKRITHANIFKEAIQVAATAIRLAAEGDASFALYDPKVGYFAGAYVCSQCGAEVTLNSDTVRLTSNRLVCSDVCFDEWQIDHV